jgi:hypothetical protein
MAGVFSGKWAMSELTGKRVLVTGGAGFLAGPCSDCVDGRSRLLLRSQFAPHFDAQVAWGDGENGGDC